VTSLGGGFFTPAVMLLSATVRLFVQCSGAVFSCTFLWYVNVGAMPLIYVTVVFYMLLMSDENGSVDTPFNIQFSQVNFHSQVRNFRSVGTVLLGCLRLLPAPVIFIGKW
jgi:hypothetical protein